MILTTQQVLIALLKQETLLDQNEILTSIQNDIDSINSKLGVETKLNAIKAIIASSGSNHTKTLLDAWNSDFIKYVTNAKRSSYELDETQFKTQFRFSSPEEKAIYTRFAGNPQHHKTNKYMLHLIVSKGDFAYKDAKGKYFFHLEDKQSKHIVARFDEITSYEFCVVDKEFLVNNELPRNTEAGKRYIYYVSKEDFDASTKESWKVHTQSKVHKDCTVFKTYESLVEYLEERVKMKAIYVLSDHAANALRYMIDSIDFVLNPAIKCEEGMLTFDIDKWTKFLGFNKLNKDKYIVKDKVLKRRKVDKYESAAIRIDGELYVDREVTEKYPYVLQSYSKAAGKALLYRPVKRKGVIEDVRYIIIGNYKITIDSKLLKIENVESIDVEDYISNTKDIRIGKIMSLCVKPDIYEKYQVAFDEIAEQFVIQRLTNDSIQENVS